ncbi:hypothetical protein NPIL_322991 [Nephila pilipes]|uniref:Uncharacterized protein n=1 Tax=Nephila pilipes TaxID=299642 RepID=A0A8X6R8Z5_NEPPI|nr:hypothetical protein NPIL_322991 [Nephila pilipes]
MNVFKWIEPPPKRIAPHRPLPRWKGTPTSSLQTPVPYKRSSEVIGQQRKTQDIITPDKQTTKASSCEQVKDVPTIHYQGTP